MIPIRSRVTSLALQLLTLIAGVREFTDRVVRVIDSDTPILLDAGSAQHRTVLSALKYEAVHTIILDIVACQRSPP